MNLIDTVPSGRATDIGIFSFGPMPTQNPSFKNLTINHTMNIGGFSFGGDTTLLTVSFPNLTQVDPTDAQQGQLSLDNCSSCTSLSVPNLTYVGGLLITTGTAITTLSLPNLITIAGESFGGNFSALAVGSAVATLTSFSAPNLTTLGGQLEFGGIGNIFSFPALNAIVNQNGGIILDPYTGTTLSAPNLGNIHGNIIAQVATAPNLTTLNLPNLVPFPGSTITFSGGKLNAASINLILARCVANGAFTTGNLVLNGGTNAAPTGQGIADKATLIGRGVTVATN